MKILKSDEFKKRNRHINEDLRYRTIEMDMNTYIDLLKRTFDGIPDTKKSEDVIEVFPYVLDYISENDLLTKHPYPKAVVDAILNADYISREDEEMTYDEWETYCKKEGLIYSDNYAVDDNYGDNNLYFLHRCSVKDSTFQGGI